MKNYYFLSFLFSCIVGAALLFGFTFDETLLKQKQRNNTYYFPTNTNSNARSLDLNNALASDSTNRLATVNNQKKLISTAEEIYSHNQHNSNTSAPSAGAERTIGFTPENPMQNSGNEAFVISLERLPNIGEAVYLEYELYGVEDFTQVSRSINNQPAFGGYFVKKNTTWNQQSEPINPATLQKGENIVRFSIPEDAQYSYRIRNLKLVIEPITLERRKGLVNIGRERNATAHFSLGDMGKQKFDRCLVVSQPTTSYYYQKYGYVQGYICGEGSADATIQIGHNSVRLYNGEFEGLATKPLLSAGNTTDTALSNAWTVTVIATFPDGEVLTTDVAFEKPAEWDFTTGFNSTIHYTEKLVATNQDFTVELDKVSLSGTAGALSNDTKLSITALRSIDIPRMNPGMINVTAGYDAYRFLPHGSQFNKPLSVKIGYDTTKLPKGHHPNEIRTYYYDNEKHTWIALPRDTVNASQHLVCSRTTHFTDMINAIIKLPEMSEIQEYAPTTLKDLEVANPSAGMQIMQPPTPNSQGTANVSYPINLPAGRKGLQPNLAVQYSSETKNGLLGMGWDMSIPAITVDTRWGVPRYSSSNESETYLLNGEELLPSARLTNNWENRSGSEKQFFPQVEGSFDSIVRKGTSPQNYYWIVTDKTGTKYYYGTYTGTSRDNTVVLQDAKGNGAYWPLCKVEDLDKNFVKYHYTIREQKGALKYYENDTHTVRLGKQLWLDNITYTGHGDTEGKYKVVFCSDNCSIEGAANMQSMGATFMNAPLKSTEIYNMDNTIESENTEQKNIDQELVRWVEKNETILVSQEMGQQIEKIEEYSVLQQEDEIVYSTDEQLEDETVIELNENAINTEKLSEESLATLSNTTIGLKNFQQKAISFPNKSRMPHKVTFYSSITKEPLRNMDVYLYAYWDSYEGPPSRFPILYNTGTTGSINFLVEYEQFYELRYSLCENNTRYNRCRINLEFGIEYLFYRSVSSIEPNTNLHYKPYYETLCGSEEPLGNHCMQIYAHPDGTEVPIRIRMFKKDSTNTRIDPSEDSASYLLEYSDRRTANWAHLPEDDLKNGYSVGLSLLETNRIHMIRTYDNGKTMNSTIDLKPGLCGKLDVVRYSPELEGKIYLEKIGGPAHYCNWYLEIREPLKPILYSKVKIQKKDINNTLVDGLITYKIYEVSALEKKLIKTILMQQGITPEIELEANKKYKIEETKQTIPARYPFIEITVGIKGDVEMKNYSEYEYNRVTCSKNGEIWGISIVDNEEHYESARIRIQKQDLISKQLIPTIYYIYSCSSRECYRRILLDSVTTQLGIIPIKELAPNRIYMLQEKREDTCIKVPPSVEIEINSDKTVEIFGKWDYNSTSIQLSEHAVWDIIATKRINTDLKKIQIHNKDENGNLIAGEAKFAVYRKPDLERSIAGFFTEIGKTPEIELSLDNTYHIIQTSVAEGYKRGKQASFDVVLDCRGQITVLNASSNVTFSKTDALLTISVKNEKEGVRVRDKEPFRYDDCKMEGAPDYVPDLTFNARYGFRQSSKDKLRKVIVYYNNECVRSYRFCYATDSFGRAQLREIEQFSADTTESPFTHKMTYYAEKKSTNSTYVASEFEPWGTKSDDLMISLTGSEFESKIQKILPRTIGNWAKPTALGGTQSFSFGGGGGPSIGLGFESVTKMATFGYNGNGTGSWSKGRLMLADVDGDGLPDKVFQKEGQVFYRPQIPGEKRFDEGERKPLGVSDFLRENSTNVAHGLQGSCIVYGGVQWPKTESTTSIYTTDIDGDGFLDVAINGNFSRLGKTFIPPQLSEEECSLPKVEKEESLVAEAKCNTNLDDSVGIIIEPMFEYTHFSPKYDIVKVLDLKRDIVGTNKYPSVDIVAPIWLKKSLQETNFCGEEDAIIASIEIQDPRKQYLDLVWIDTIWANDERIHVDPKAWQDLMKWKDEGAVSANKIPSGNIKYTKYQRPFDRDNLMISSIYGEEVHPKIFFRVRPLDKGVNKDIVWDPFIYTTPDFKYTFDGDKVELGSNRQLLHQDSAFICPFKGKLTILYDFKIHGNDEYRYCSSYVIRNNDTIKIYRWSSSGVKDKFSINVEKNDAIYFPITSEEREDWVSTKWNTQLLYETITYDDNITVTIQDSMVRYYPIPTYTFYKCVQVSTQQYNKKEVEYYGKDFVEVNGNGIISSGEKVVFSERKPYNHTAGISNLKIYETKNIEGYIGSNYDMMRAETSVFDVYTSNKISNNYFGRIIRQEKYKASVFVKHDKTHSVYGHMYGNWGQFLYRNDGEKVMQLEKLNFKYDSTYAVNNIDTTKKFADSAAQLKGMLAREKEYTQANIIYELPVIPMIPDNKLGGYRGLTDDAWIKGNRMHLGRTPCYQDDKGQPIVDLCKSSTMATQSAAQPMSIQSAPQSNVQTQSTTAGRGRSKISKTEMRAWNLGISLGPVGKGDNSSEGDSYLLNDLMDLNGDGYPDVIQSGKVQYTLPFNGRLEDFSEKKFGLTHHKTEIFSMGTTFSGDFGGLWKASSSSGKGTFQLTRSGTSANASGAICEDNADVVLIDINGDGLPDKIDKNAMVSINLGYRFEAPEPWNGFMYSILENTNKSMDIGVGAGGNGTATIPDFPNVGGVFSEFDASIGGGISFSRSDNFVNRMLIDVNGDGLPDLIERVSPNLEVRLNTGIGFSSEKYIWDKGLSNKAWSQTRSVTVSISLTQGILIPTFFIVPIKLTFTENLSGGMTINRPHTQIMDIDGDGFADILTSDSEDDLRVKRSNIGKSGLLKSVSTPMGATYTMSYTMTDATVFHSRRWVMDTLVINDNFLGDGADKVMTTYEYQDGYYDRQEKSFNGFSRVTSTEHNTMNNDAAYRITTRYYHVDSIYRKGLLAYETVEDTKGTLYVLTKNAYQSKKVHQGKSYFPALVKTTTCYFEGKPEADVTHIKTYKYDDKYGNLLEQEESGTNIESVKMNVAYHSQRNNNYCVGIPSKAEIVTPGGGKQETDINDKGKITTLRQYYNQNQYLVTTLKYDNYGNCIYVKYPNQLSYTYVYDKNLHTYIDSVRNNKEHSSYTTEYDYRFGVPKATVALNSSKTTYEYDNWGRILTIQGPKEKGAVKTIRYEYYNSNINKEQNNHASTHTYQGNILIQCFADGLGRIVQTKKTAEIDNVLANSISGHQQYDAFGRVIKSYYPTKGDSNNYRYESKLSQNFSVTEYDILDRPTLQKTPKNEITTIKYGFIDDILTNKKLAKTDIITHSGTTTIGKNLLGLECYRKIGDDNPVALQYNPFGNLLQIKSVDESILRTMEYDIMGRITLYKQNQSEERYIYNNYGNLYRKEITGKNPITGADLPKEAMQYTYDTLGRLVETAFLNSDKQPIKYKYDTIYYTENDFMNLFDAILCRGKLTYQEDETGIQYFIYGLMGEVIKTNRTFALPVEGNEPLTFETYFSYDSWGRIQNIIYPDYEAVTYSYDRGGQLKSIKGTKQAQPYTYIENIMYNEFGEKTFVQYGNGGETTFKYDVNRRLENYVFQTPLLHISANYQYDAVGNITSLQRTNTMNGKLYKNYKETFTYNSRNELITANATAVDITGNTVTPYANTIEYKPNGKIFKYNLQYAHGSTNAVDVKNEYTYQNKTCIPKQMESYVLGQKQTTLLDWDLRGALRKKTNITTGNVQYYLFDEVNQLKAFSENEQIFGYYSYDANGERGIKLNYNMLGVWNNRYNGSYSLELEKATIYPNGYITVTQNGDYTKHYYAGADRICSKIGSGNTTLWSLKDALKPKEKTIIKSIQKQQVGFAASQLAKLIKKWDISIYASNLEMGNTWRPKAVYQNNANATENLVYYYHGNHLGSTHVVTDKNGELSQQIEYSPFGEVISEYQRGLSDDYQTDYLFNGKQYDEESGLYNYGARYYGPKDIIFISPDPLQDKRPWLTPYHYCSNNPLNRIDPTGMLDHEYQMERNGETKLLKQTDDNFDKVYSTNSKGGVNKSNSIKLEKGILSSKTTTQGVKGSSSDGQISESDVDVYTSFSDKSAKKLFNFAAKNTDVEWSHVKGEVDGINVNYVGTGHNDGSDISQDYITNSGYLSPNVNIRGADHSHTNNSSTVSQGDINVANKIQSRFPNAKFNIYQPRFNKYVPYDKNSTPGLFKEIIIKGRR